jgi:hypothetical protein
VKNKGHYDFGLPFYQPTSVSRTAKFRLSGASMKIPSKLNDARWKSLYTAALFEDDRNKVPQLITVAEAEIVRRARHLFGAPGDNSDEAEALDDALYMLRALRNCLKTQAMDHQIAAQATFSPQSVVRGACASVRLLPRRQESQGN